MRSHTRKVIGQMNQIARKLKRQGSPTKGELAVTFWRELSSNYSSIPFEIGIKLYKKAGYCPYEGYPLKRLTNINISK